MSTLKATNLQHASSASANITLNSNGTIGGACLTQTCRAWVNFNGTLAAASMIRASYNVSSITDNGAGDYTINFTAAMPDANYSVIATAGGGNKTGTNPVVQIVTASVATGSVDVVTAVGTGLPSDRDLLAVAIFR